MTRLSMKTIKKLNEKDLKKLLTGVMMKRINEEKPEEILGPVYLIKQERILTQEKL